MMVGAFNNTYIKRRNTISSYPSSKLNFEIFLGNTIFALILWLLYLVVSFVLYKEIMMSTMGLLLAINSLLFSISALAIGVLVGNLVKNKEAQNSIATTLSLGSSFICGAFVPQYLLGNFVLGIARIFPSYYFITNNNIITTLSNYNFTSLKPIMTNLVIIIGFTIIFIIINNIISKRKV